MTRNLLAKASGLKAHKKPMTFQFRYGEVSLFPCFWVLTLFSFTSAF